MNRLEAIEILETMAMAESTFSDEESKKCCEAIDFAIKWLAYACHPAHIDLEAWEPCQKCSGKCAFCMWVESKRCEVCEERDEYAAFFNFCPHCGRPLTEVARADLEKRLRG